MILTEDEFFAALDDDITAIEETRACEEEWAVIVAMCRAIEAAVISKLAQGASVEPVPGKCKDCRSTGLAHCGDPVNCGGMEWFYTPDQLQTAIAAARVKALEDAALNCEELHWTWRMGDNSGPKECAEKIRTLKGGA